MIMRPDYFRHFLLSNLSSGARANHWMGRWIISKCHSIGWLIISDRFNVEIELDEKYKNEIELRAKLSIMV